MLKDILVLPTYEFEFPSSGKKIQFRPYVTKERKLLLMALEGEDIDEITNVIYSTIKNCVLTEGFDLKKIPIFDLEAFFLRLRAKSVGEKREVKYECENEIEGKKCKGTISIDVDLMDVKLTEMSHDQGKIMLSDGIGVMMKYPTLEIMETIESKNWTSGTEMSIDFIASCIDYVFNKESIHKPQNIQEATEFLENLTDENFSKIERFFDDLPVLRKIYETECPKCKYKHYIVLEGLQSFFE